MLNWRSTQLSEPSQKCTRTHRTSSALPSVMWGMISATINNTNFVQLMLLNSTPVLSSHWQIHRGILMTSQWFMDSAWDSCSNLPITAVSDQSVGGSWCYWGEFLNTQLVHAIRNSIRWNKNCMMDYIVVIWREKKWNLGHAVDPVLQSRQGSAGAILLLMQRCALTGRAVRASGGSRARVWFWKGRGNRVHNDV